MFTYEDVIKDEEIDEYYEIGLKNDIYLWANHGKTHALAVAEMSGKMLEIFGATKEEIEAGKIAGILHDIGCINGKKNHAKIGYEMTKKYLKDKEYNEELKNRIALAIKNHSEGTSEDEIAMALFFADKIDLDKNRIAEHGYEVEGLKEIQYTEKIDFEIKNDDFVLNFYVKDKFNQQSFMNYYFYPKVIKAVDLIANKLGKKGQIKYINVN